jgi:hypothetical protein
VTGNGLQSDIDTYMSKGATGVMIKPLDIGSWEQMMADSELPIP